MESIQQTIAPYMVIQHSLGMWTLDSGSWNRDSLSVELGFRIPTVVSGIPDCKAQPDSTSKNISGILESVLPYIGRYVVYTYQHKEWFYNWPTWQTFWGELASSRERPGELASRLGENGKGKHEWLTTEREGNKESAFPPSFFARLNSCLSLSPSNGYQASIENR